MTPIWQVFGLALVLSLAFTPAIRALARRAGCVARPRADRWHTREVALLGGVAVFAAFLMSVAWGGAVVSHGRLLIVLAGGMFVAGLWDDLRPLRPATKLLAQIAAGLAVAFASRDVQMTPFPAIDTLLITLWVVAVTNAINLLDNMDGLAAGVALIAALFGMALGLQPANSVALVLLAALAGALAGFLVYNFNPASIFMGDSGSLFIGFVLAATAVPGGEAGQLPLVAVLSIPAVLLAIPLLDTALVATARLLAGRQISAGGRDHTSHRLVAIGLTERLAVLFLYSLATAAGLVAVAIQRSGLGTSLILIGVFGVGLTLFAVHIGRVRVYEEGHLAALAGRPFTPLLMNLTYKRRIFEVLLDLVLVTVAYSAAFHLRFEDDVAREFHGPFARSVPVVVVCKMLGLWAAGVYGGVWRYLSITDLTTYVKGVLLGSGLAVLAVVYLYRFEGFSRGAFIMDAMILFLLLVGSRLSFRLLLESAGRRRSAGTPVLIYGAGAGGALLLRELISNSDYNWRPVGLLDDDPHKHGQRILGLRVFGGLTDLEAVLDRTGAEQIIISTTAVEPERLERLREICRHRQVGVRRMHFRIE